MNTAFSFNLTGTSGRFTIGPLRRGDFVVSFRISVFSQVVAVGPTMRAGFFSQTPADATDFAAGSDFLSSSAVPFSSATGTSEYPVNREVGERSRFTVEITLEAGETLVGSIWFEISRRRSDSLGHKTGPIW